MSGFDVAGVILGAIPLLISALENYKAAKGRPYSFRHYRGQLDKLIEKLEAQRFCYHLHIHNLLQDAGVKDAQQTFNLSEEDCARILEKATTEGHMKKYFGDIYYARFLKVIERYHNCLKTIALGLENIHRLPNVKKDDLAAIVAANQREAGTFVFKKRVKFTIKRRMLETLIDDLHEDRLSLETIVKGMESLQKHVPREPSGSAAKLAKVFMQVQVNAKPLFEVCACQCSKRHKVLMRLDNRMPLQKQDSELGSNTKFNLILELEEDLQEALVRASQAEHGADDDSQAPSKDAATKPPIDIPTIHVIDTTGKSQSYPAKPTRMKRICHHAYEAQSSKNILNLQLHRNHLSLFEGPVEARREFLRPVTLENCLRDGTQNAKIQMTLVQRNLLALDIAAGILQLRQTCWFSSPFDSKGIKLFRQNGVNVTIVLEPFIEQVVEESVPRQSNITGGPEPKTALLELAILLLEIWHHEPLEGWMGRTGLEHIESKEARMKAAIKWEEETEKALLQEHLTAIDFCVSIFSGRSRSWDDVGFIKDYCENIIKPLYEICKPCLDSAWYEAFLPQTRALRYI